MQDRLRSGPVCPSPQREAAAARQAAAQGGKRKGQSPQRTARADTPAGHWSFGCAGRPLIGVVAMGVALLASTDTIRLPTYALTTQARHCSTFAVN
jgi:hypothetical protein